MRLDLVLRVVTKFVLPWVLVFGVYVQFHGHYSPGGGFQAGVIVAAGFILYGLIYGLQRLDRLLPLWIVEVLIPLGVLIFAGVGVFGFFTAEGYLDYSGLAEDPARGEYWGIFVVEAGVGITVAATMLALFYLFAGRGRA